MKWQSSLCEFRIYHLFKMQLCIIRLMAEYSSEQGKKKKVIILKVKSNVMNMVQKKTRLTKVSHYT